MFRLIISVCLLTVSSKTDRACICAHMLFLLRKSHTGNGKTARRGLPDTITMATTDGKHLFTANTSSEDREEGAERRTREAGRMSKCEMKQVYHVAAQNNH